MFAAKYCLFDLKNRSAVSKEIYGEDLIGRYHAQNKVKNNGETRKLPVILRRADGIMMDSIYVVAFTPINTVLAGQSRLMACPV